jgi:hypothetical protein
VNRAITAINLGLSDREMLNVTFVELCDVKPEMSVKREQNTLAILTAVSRPVPK